MLARVSRNRKLHVRDDTNYQDLVYPTLTDAPPCWLQLAPALKELLALEEDSEEEKESISKSCCCICNCRGGGLLFFGLPDRASGTHRMAQPCVSMTAMMEAPLHSPPPGR